jgi:hypothetical protein
MLNFPVQRRLVLCILREVTSFFLIETKFLKFRRSEQGKKSILTHSSYLCPNSEVRRLVTSLKGHICIHVPNQDRLNTI